MVRAVVSAHVNAPPERVRAQYEEPSNWGKLFPETIRSARVVRRDRRTTVVEVEHVEGRVLNVLHDVSPTRIDLDEFKRKYNATFTNEFIPEGSGTRYRLTASVRLKWPYRLLSFLLKPLVLARMRRYVVEPLKAAAEASVH